MLRFTTMNVYYILVNEFIYVHTCKKKKDLILDKKIALNYLIYLFVYSYVNIFIYIY